MAGEVTFPVLPCQSMKEMLAFYVAMGFEITYQTTRPNTYACVKYEDIELHFFSMKAYEPKNSYSTCIVLVPYLAALHQTFSDNLRGHFGKLPIAGIPRISKLNNSNSDKQLRFNVIDPGGNWVRFAQKGEQPTQIPQDGDQSSLQEEPTKLSRAVQAADWVAEAEGDFEKAAKVLDTALAHNDPAPSTHRVQALVLRAAVAISMSDPSLARTLLTDMRRIDLSDEMRTALAAELQRADDLEQMLA